MPIYTASRYHPERKEMVHEMLLLAISPRDAAERAMGCRARRQKCQPYHPDNRISPDQVVTVSYTTNSGRKLHLPFIAAEMVGAGGKRNTPRFQGALA